MNNKVKTLIFKRAWYLFKTNQKPTFRDALIYSWHIQKTKSVTPADIEKVYKEVAGQLTAWVNHRLSYTTAQQSLTEDFVQDTFLHVMEKIHMFDPNKATMKTWIHTLCKNLIIDNSRKRSENFNNSNIISYDEHEMEVADVQPKSDKGVYNAIVQTIQGLKETYRNVAMLRFVQGKQLNEIATELDMPLNTVKVTIMRCKEILKPQLEMYRG